MLSASSTVTLIARLVNRVPARMPSFPNYYFAEAQEGDNQYHRIEFLIESTCFVVVFSLIDTTDPVYMEFRSSEIGFAIPDSSYDVKFDTLDNFKSGSLYAASTIDSPFRVLGYHGLVRLSNALRRCIDLHFQTYNAKLYVAVAENERLVRFYDRLVCGTSSDVDYEVISELGQGGKGYAIKTSSF